jgi:hypothetical protein
MGAVKGWLLAHWCFDVSASTWDKNQSISCDFFLKIVVKVKLRLVFTIFYSFRVIARKCFKLEIKLSKDKYCECGHDVSCDTRISTLPASSRGENDNCSPQFGYILRISYWLIFWSQFNYFFFMGTAWKWEKQKVLVFAMWWIAVANVRYSNCWTVHKWLEVGNTELGFVDIVTWVENQSSRTKSKLRYTI